MFYLMVACGAVAIGCSIYILYIAYKTHKHYKEFLLWEDELQAREKKLEDKEESLKVRVDVKVPDHLEDWDERFQSHMKAQ